MKQIFLPKNDGIIQIPPMLFKRLCVIIFLPVLLLSGSLIAQPAIQWDKTYGGLYYERPEIVKQTSDGGYIVGGVSSSETSGDKSEASRGGGDYWILKIAADGTKQWDKTFGGSKEDYLCSILQTADGGYLLGGTSYSGAGGDKSQEKMGTWDFWIVKTDANGVKEWDRTLGGSDFEYLKYMSQCSDGGYILGGTSASGISGQKTHASRGGGSDCWIVKLFADGSVQWDKTIGGRGGDGAVFVEETPDLGFILGAATDSGIGGDKTSEGRGGSGFWLIKIKADGSAEWDKTIGSGGWDILSAMTQTNDGGFILGGWTETGISGDKTQSARGESDYWVVKVTENGTIQWDRTLGGTSRDELSSISETYDGNFLIGGYTNSQAGGDKTENLAGNAGYTLNSRDDYWVVKLRPDGSKVWDKNLGGHSMGGIAAAYNKLYSVQQTLDGGYMLAGESNADISGNKTADSKGSNDFWVIKLAPDETVRPFALRYFLASKQGTKVLLDWKTVTESGSDRFELEHCTDGQSWAVLATIEAGKTRYSDAMYHFEHSVALVAGEENYYRLKMVDSNGSFTYSEIRKIDKPLTGWGLTLGGSNEEWLNDLHQTSDGGYIIGGHSRSGVSGDKTENGRGGDDYWVVKLAADRTIEWDKTFGGGTTDILGTVLQTPDGGYILGGYSNSDTGGDKSEDNNSVTDQDGYLPPDYWIVKLSANGTKEWDRTYGGLTEDLFKTLKITSDGGYIMGGGANGSYNILKLSVNGNKEWERNYNGFAHSIFTTVNTTSDGGFILGGASSAGVGGDKTEVSKGRYDIWIIKIAQNGDVQWDKSFGTDELDELQSVDETADGGYLICGFSKGGANGDKSEENKGGTDSWIIKTDSKGRKIWDRTLGGDLRLVDNAYYTGSSLLSFVKQTRDGSYILGGGSSAGSSEDKTADFPGYWIVKLSADGKNISNQTIGGPTDGVMIPTSDGHYVLGRSAVTGQTRGGQDYWVVQVFGEKENDVSLPVALTNFMVKKEGMTAVLDWTTTSETSSDRFEIQHSLTGKAWTPLAAINSKGESLEIVHYQYVHSNPATGKTNLYRLKMIDTDGSFAIVVSVT